MTKQTIFCDMDGVLVDFIGGTTDILGHHIDDKQTRPKWESWGILHGTKGMWANLPILHDAMHLWDFINPYEAQILSAAPQRGNGYIEKVQWILKHLGDIGQDRVNIVNREDKVDYAVVDGVQGILIDDYLRNINEFEEAGGIGIHHTTAENTIAQLKELGF